MKKITHTTIKKQYGPYHVTPLDQSIRKDLKNERFRKGFFEELNRLQLAHEIKRLRQRKRMTQKQVAEKASMPQSVIARMESGTHRYSLSTLSQIAQVFGKTIGFKEA